MIRKGKRSVIVGTRTGLYCTFASMLLAESVIAPPPTLHSGPAHVQIKTFLFSRLSQPSLTFYICFSPPPTIPLPFHFDNLVSPWYNFRSWCWNLNIYLSFYLSVSLKGKLVGHFQKGCGLVSTLCQLWPTSYLPSASCCEIFLVDLSVCCFCLLDQSSA